MQLLIFAPANSPRLKYTCQFIFKEILLVDFVITTSIEAFNAYTGIKINYSNQPVNCDCFTICAHGLLFENDIKQQDTTCFVVNNYKAFFKTPQADFPFEIFSATFYLLSRYEEYLPHAKDMYGRYAHENSLAFKQSFLHLPLINIWIEDFAERVQAKYASFATQRSAFSFIPTYDIDMAFEYQHKGWLRNIGGFSKSPSLKRIKVLLAKEQDPFDCYGWLNALHDQYNLQPLYFFLMAKQNGPYDKNILPYNKALQQLIKEHAQKYATGIHPSWQSGDKLSLLKQEKNKLENIAAKPITKSRQHYIRFNLPDGYTQLLQHEITDDYSMGYGSINGFRASVAASFFWYNLQKDEATSLRLHPFCFMEANSFYEQKYTAAQAYDELLHYYTACKKVNGQLITIWHNNFLGTATQFADWREVYKFFLALVQSRTPQ